jgi:hypothetical protein
LAVKKILSHLAMRTEPLPRTRALDLTGQQRFDLDAAQSDPLGMRFRTRQADVCLRAASRRPSRWSMATKSQRWEPATASA